MWAIPKEDMPVMDIYKKYLPKFENPLKLRDILNKLQVKIHPI